MEGGTCCKAAAAGGDGVDQDGQPQQFQLHAARDHGLSARSLQRLPAATRRRPVPRFCGALPLHTACDRLRRVLCSVH